MHDLKILLLYILSRLNEPVKADKIAMLAGAAVNATFFEIASALDSLAETGSITNTAGEYAISEKGEAFGGDLYRFLTFSSRMKAERAIYTYKRSRSHSQIVSTEREAARRGGVYVKVTMKDGGDEIISLKLLTPNDETARQIEVGIAKKPTEIYNIILRTVFEENIAENRQD